ncbi:MAG: RNA 3'-terminal phosphate cyclase [Candidatus Heimdallarchaeota archaeon]
MTKKMITIDGSMLEGGGAIIRNSIALSAIRNQPIRIINIRANRPKPGLRNQHMYVIKTIGEMCNARIESVSVGSKEIQFFPGEIKGGEYKVDVQTAGSLTLLLQAIIPVAIHAPDTVKLLMKGGTDVAWSPPFDYMRYVYVPMMEKLGLNITLCVGRRGHYPKGGGALSCDIEPLLRMKPIIFKFDDPFSVDCICGRAHAVKLPPAIADRMINSAMKELEKNNYKIGVIESECPEPKYDTHIAPGTGIILWSCNNHGTILAGDCLGKKGLPAEEVGKIAAKNLIEQLKTKKPIDYHLADQLIIWMGLSDFPSVIETTKITSHTLTNIELLKIIAKSKFKVEGKEGQPGIISCEPTPKT